MSYLEWLTGFVATATYFHVQVHCTLLLSNFQKNSIIVYMTDLKLASGTQKIPSFFNSHCPVYRQRPLSCSFKSTCITATSHRNSCPMKNQSMTTHVSFEDEKIILMMMMRIGQSFRSIISLNDCCCGKNQMQYHKASSYTKLHSCVTASQF